MSSTLNRDVKQFGKKFLFDGDEETCWNSDEGSPQFVQIDFHRQVIPKQLRMTFQGGFAGKTCLLLGGNDKASLAKICDFYPDDVNTQQVCGNPIIMPCTHKEPTFPFFSPLFPAMIPLVASHARWPNIAAGIGHMVTH